MANYKCVCKKKTCNFKKIKHCTNQRKYISVIAPTYNEKENIKRLTIAVSKVLAGKNFEIVIIDDNSRDGTAEIIDKLAKKREVVALHRYGISNIFSAIQDGIKLSRGENIVIMDSDFSHPPAIIPELLKYINEYDIVSASRFIRGSNIKAPFARKYATIGLNFVVRLILGLKQKDLTGGFHAIRKEAFNKLKFKYPAIWGEFDMELFHQANKNNLKIKEIPFTYNFRKEGKSKSKSLLKYGLVYLTRAVQLRFSR